MSVIPYIPGVDGIKNSLAGACDFFLHLTDSHQE